MTHYLFSNSSFFHKSIFFSLEEHTFIFSKHLTCNNLPFLTCCQFQSHKTYLNTWLVHRLIPLLNCFPFQTSDLCKEKGCIWVAAWLLRCIGCSYGKCPVWLHRRIIQWPGNKTERQRKQVHPWIRWGLISLLVETLLSWNVGNGYLRSAVQFSSLDTSDLET